MEEIKINFADTPDLSRKKFWKFLKIFGAVIAVAALLATLTVTRIRPDSILLAEFSQIPIIKRVRQLIASADRTLEGHDEDRVNILLLGMGGPGHDGPFLTDTIILASIKPSTKDIALISIPRDMSVPIPNYGWYKVNHANAFGESRQAGSGAELTRRVLSEILEIDIPYAVRIDFSGFVTLIDNFGGIEVDIERSFVDTAYPTDQDGEVYTVSFSAGRQHLNGTDALIFARSRHGTNGEGSDFARAARQQKILTAVEQKVLSLGTLRSPGKISAVLETFKDHISTNFSPWEFVAIAHQVSGLDRTRMITKVLSDGPNGQLVPVIGVDGAYLLAPRNNDWTEIRQLVSFIFDETAGASRPAEKPVRVEIQNGTMVNGLAAKTAALLQEQGFTVSTIGNAKNRNAEKTIIYDFSHGKNKDALQKLRTIFPAGVWASLDRGDFPSDRQNFKTDAGVAYAATEIDFLIVLGNDHQKNN